MNLIVWFSENKRIWDLKLYLNKSFRLSFKMNFLQVLFLGV